MELESELCSHDDRWMDSRGPAMFVCISIPRVGMGYSEL